MLKEKRQNNLGIGWILFGENTNGFSNVCIMMFKLVFKKIIGTESAIITNTYAQFFLPLYCF